MNVRAVREPPLPENAVHKPQGWARCREDTADVIRRGAWYPVLERTSEGGLIVEVEGRQFFLSEAQVHFSETPPDKWCVVSRDDVFRDRGVGGGEVPPRYAVCHQCRHRQDLEGRPGSLVCESCGQVSPVDYECHG